MDASRNSLFSNFSYISPLNAQMNEEIPFTFQQIRCSYTIFKSKFCVYIKGRYPRNHVDKQEKVCLNQLIFLLQTNLKEISQLFQIVPQKTKIGFKMKKTIGKGHTSFQVFQFQDLKLVPTDSALNFASGNLLIGTKKSSQV